MFHRGFQTLENNERTRPFIYFLVFGNPDETLALVSEILLLCLHVPVPEEAMFLSIDVHLPALLPIDTIGRKSLEV